MSDVGFAPELVVDGIYFPPHPYRVPWSQHIDAVRSMTVREDDVFIVASPKAGTHWLWEIVYMLLSGKAEYETRSKHHLMIEFTTVDRMDAEASPRVFNTHLPFSMLPVRQMMEKQVKVLHMYRNPKDTAVSTWFHYRQLEPREGAPLWSKFTLSEFVQKTMENTFTFGTWLNFMKQVETFALQHPDFPIHSMSFEELKRHPAECVKSLVQYLQIEVADQLCENIAIACSFRNLKVASGSKSLPQGTAIGLGAQVYRRVTLVGKAEITQGLRMGRSDVVRNARKRGEIARTIDGIRSRGVEKSSVPWADLI